MTGEPKDRAIDAFRQAYGAQPAVVARAPGRVNLIGEHTDYNDGFVLPCAIELHTAVAASPRTDDIVRVVAADYGTARGDFALNLPIPHDVKQGWSNYVRGVATAMLARGMPARGADLAIAGNLPQGGGLSSSASLEVAVAAALRQLHGPAELTLADLALVGQRAENEFVGCNCGIMDQMISACGREQHALLIDCRSLALTPVRIPAELALVIVNSNVARGLVDSEYNLRRRQCEAASGHFGVKNLRDVSPAMLAAAGIGLDATALRRARHVIGENARVLAMRDALHEEDLERVGILMSASHASMRDDFEITVPPIDRLVEVLTSVIGPRGGARMTGGGFGGCVVALMPRELVGRARQAVEDSYRTPDGRKGSTMVCRAAAGVEVA
jgi:galactokinase